MTLSRPLEPRRRSLGERTDTAYYLARVFADRNHLADAKTLLDGALKTPGPFAMRRKAKALLEQISKAK